LKTAQSIRSCDILLKKILASTLPTSRCEIIPYGIDVPEGCVESSGLERFSVLFVGSGTQRKGLHHLLLAWQAASLPSGSQLTLICRVVDPGIAALARQMSNVHLTRGVSRNQLKDLYKSSSILVMPSLVEGFGQVYLEALAEGCPVLGTSNTCLPDLYGDEKAIWQVEPGNLDQLISMLEAASRTLPGDLAVRDRARACAARWPWARFRNGIRFALTLDKSSERETNTVLSYTNGAT
jgi:glycosyltransferase involved in cell wall biosynthesis